MEYNRGIDILNREIEKFVEQGINAIENAKLLKSIEEKSIELHKKNLLLGKNINRLKSIEKFASILYSYNDLEIVIKSLVFLILSEIGVNIKKSGFFSYKSDEKIFEIDVLYETEKVQFLEGIFREKYITKIDEFIKEITKAGNKLSDTRINISSSILKRIGETRSLYIDRSERDAQLKNLMTLLNSSKGYIFLSSDKEQTFGILFVEVSNELEEEERKLITYLLEVLAIFIKKQILEREQVEMDVIKEMRCTGCNRKLLTYKGKIDFVETKCTKCNTMNKIANPKD